MNAVPGAVATGFSAFDLDVVAVSGRYRFTHASRKDKFDATESSLRTGACAQIAG